MTPTILAISFAYVVIGILLLSMGLTSRFAWWIKAAAIVVTSVFFVEVFFATKGLLGWPGTGKLPPRFQLLWTRVVEPDPKLADHGSIYLWVEEVDTNNVPTGVPRSYRLPYSRPLADKSNKARDEIMSGNPQEGSADDLTANENTNDSDVTRNTTDQALTNVEPGTSRIEFSDDLRDAPHVEFKPMGVPLLPPKP